MPEVLLIVLGVVLVLAWWATYALVLWAGWKIGVSALNRVSPRFVPVTFGEIANRLAGEPPRSYRG